MKKISALFSSLLMAHFAFAQSPAISFTNNTGTSVITCVTQSISVQASVSNYTNGGSFTYSWISSPAVLTGSNVIISQPGNYTVFAFNAQNNFSLSAQLPAILINTFTPVSTISPTFQTITCASLATTFTASSSVPNAAHAWINPYSNSAAYDSGYFSLFNPSAPGTYTHVLTNNDNGCSTTKTVVIAANTSFPNFNINSPSQFTIACGIYSITSVSLNNFQTNPPGSAVLNALLNPWSAGSYTLSPISVFTLNTPGTYTVIVKDLSNNCESRVPFSIVQFSTVPAATIISTSQVLTCNSPSLMLTAIGASNLSYSWTSSAGVFPGSTFLVNGNANNTSTTLTTYSLQVKDNNNLCVSIQTIAILQDKVKPNAAIATSSPVLTCFIPTVVLTNNSNSGPGPGFPNIVASAWYGPPAQPSLANTSTYVVYAPGTYTMIAQNMNNGCTSLATIAISDNRIFPVLIPPPPYQFTCIDPNIDILINVAGPTSLSYTWTGPSILTPTNAIGVTVNQPGIYTVTAMNLLNGCRTTQQVTVNACGTGIDAVQAPDRISFFRNPVNESLTVGIKGLHGNYQLEVWSPEGKLLKKLEIRQDLTPIDLRNEQNGLFLFRVTAEGKAVKTAKILKK